MGTTEGVVVKVLNKKCGKDKCCRIDLCFKAVCLVSSKTQINFKRITVAGGVMNNVLPRCGVLVNPFSGLPVTLLNTHFDNLCARF